eukprot:356323-Chlamydomonas_euryale.AAC.9
MPSRARSLLDCLSHATAHPCAAKALSYSTDELGINVSVDLARTKLPGAVLSGGSRTGSMVSNGIRRKGQERPNKPSSVEVGLHINLGKLTAAVPAPKSDVLLASKPGQPAPQTGLLIIGDVSADGDAEPSSTDALLARLRPPNLGCIDLASWQRRA